VIGEDFSPDRLQLRALGHLLLNAQNFPFMPQLREAVLYERVYEQYAGGERRPWLDELAIYGLIKLAPDSLRADDQVAIPPIDVVLTPAGTYYSISHAALFGMNARTPTDDFPQEIVDTPWAIQTHYSPPPDDDLMAPTADAFVKFDHNEEAFQKTLSAIDAVSDALQADNEIGAAQPGVRDEKLAELRAIRALLEKREGWRSKIISAAWITLGYILSQFADRPVGYVAQQAWWAIQTVLGIS
jgi:hypothetical protein